MQNFVTEFTLKQMNLGLCKEYKFELNEKWPQKLVLRKEFNYYHCDCFLWASGRLPLNLWSCYQHPW